MWKQGQQSCGPGRLLVKIPRQLGFRVDFLVVAVAVVVAFAILD